MSCPEPLLIENMKMKLTTKSQIEFRRLELLLIANKKMRIYSSASIAANPLLYVRPSVCPLLECCIFNSVNLKTVTQAEQEGKLFGRLASVLLVLCACQCACLVALGIRDFAYSVFSYDLDFFLNSLLIPLNTNMHFLF